MLGALSISACSKDQADSTRKIGGHTFSSDLRLYVFAMGEAGGEWESIGMTPSTHPVNIPRCRSWGVSPWGRVDMEALAREIAAKKIPYLRIFVVVDGDLAHLEGLTGLRDLDFSATDITDAGLAHLKGLTGLQWLGLWRTKVTAAGLADLKKALPKTYIR